MTDPLMIGIRFLLFAGPMLVMGLAAFPLYERPESGTRVVAKLEPRVLGTVRHCDKKWCRIFGEGFDGFMEQHLLWGVYPNEVVE